MGGISARSAYKKFHVKQPTSILASIVSLSQLGYYLHEHDVLNIATWIPKAEALLILFVDHLQSKKKRKTNPRNMMIK